MTATSHSPDLRRLERWAAPIALLVLAGLAMGNIIPNKFTRDDIGLILENPLVKSWSGVWHAFNAAYWPPADSGELYRPLSIAWLTIQWQLGGGHELLFRLCSLAAYGASCLAVWAVLKRVAPLPAAWVGAALFAVHPVHVEALVEAVSQSELIVAALLCWGVAWHIDANRGTRGIRATASAESLLFVVAVFFKEHALVFPALLIAADLLIDPTAEPFGTRWRRWRSHYGVMVLIALLFWFTRGQVLGTASGTGPHEALAGGLFARIHTMAGVPAEWLRLFLWPAHLQDEWSLMEWVPGAGWTPRETAGALAVASLGLATILAWRRMPTLAWGLVWIGLALGPVANIVIPTGVLIAERTLFLPSVGLAVALAALLTPMVNAHDRLGPVWPRVGLLGLAALLSAGMLRSALRCVDWRTPVIWTVRSVALAPLSWRTHLTYGMVLSNVGDTAGARSEVRASLALREDNPVVLKFVADRGRLSNGACIGPTIVYEEVLKAVPQRSDVRASLLACLAIMGRYEQAHQIAMAGDSIGLDRAFYHTMAIRAAQNLRTHTPIGQWRVRFPTGTATDIGGPQRSH